MLYPRRGSNPYAVRQGILSPQCLPFHHLGPSAIIRTFASDRNILRIFPLFLIMHGMYTDSHFHLLSLQQKGTDIPGLLARMESEGVHGLDIGTEVGDLPIRRKLVDGHPSFLLTAGIGPWGVGQSVRELQEEISQYGPICAIGEIGLDNHWKDYGTPAQQELLFENQIDLAEELHLPVIIHSREADMQMERILKQRTFSSQGIMHCFEGGRRLLDTALCKNFYISFSGVVTYKHNDWLQDLCTLVPDDRLLLETDSPYLAPVPMRGKPNSPLYIAYTYKKVAELRETSVSKLQTLVRDNLRSFVRQSGNDFPA